LVVSDRHLFLLAVIFYGVSALYSVFLWRRGFREDNWAGYILIGLGFIFHTVAMFKRGFTFAQCPVNNLYEAMVFVMWTIVATYLLMGSWSRLRFVGAFASPVLFAMGVFALMPALDVRGDKPYFGGFLGSLHAALILLSYGAFGLSCVAAIMYLSEEHDLKFRKARMVFSRLPPIQRLDMIISRLLAAGFILLTVGLCLAEPLMKERYGAYGVYLREDPKIAWSVFVWLIYLSLLLVRWVSKHGGRRLAWGAIGSFSFVLFTFWGFNLLSRIHHP
jgi:ABC-type transport system involved in cytochrome c biogenesis permease subunit